MKETDYVPCPKVTKAGSIPTCQLHLKIKINQSSFWLFRTGQVIDSVFDISLDCVGSLRHSCSESGVTPGIEHLSDYLFICLLFIVRVSNKKILRKEKEIIVGRNQEKVVRKNLKFS